MGGAGLLRIDATDDLGSILNGLVGVEGSGLSGCLGQDEPRCGELGAVHLLPSRRTAASFWRTSRARRPAQRGRPRLDSLMPWMMTLVSALMRRFLSESSYERTTVEVENAPDGSERDDAGERRRRADTAAREQRSKKCGRTTSFSGWPGLRNKLDTRLSGRRLGGGVSRRGRALARERANIARDEGRWGMEDDGEESEREDGFASTRRRTPNNEGKPASRTGRPGCLSTSVCCSCSCLHLLPCVRVYAATCYYLQISPSPTLPLSTRI